MWAPDSPQALLSGGPGAVPAEALAPPAAVAANSWAAGMLQEPWGWGGPEGWGGLGQGEDEEQGL